MNNKHFILVSLIFNANLLFTHKTDPSQKLNKSDLTWDTMK